MQIDRLIDLYISSIKADIKYNVIFGAAEFGVLLMEKFNKLGIKIDYFCDNNDKKHGTKINNVNCISFGALQKISGEALIFISPRKSEAIYKQMEDNNVKYIFPKELFEIVDFIPVTENYILPIGHYYSLYPDFTAIAQKADVIFDKSKDVSDIDFNDEQQLELLSKMAELYPSVPWNNDTLSLDLRYNYQNEWFYLGDAIPLHCMLRILRPKRLIEVGSGYSSAVILDTNEHFLDNKIHLSFIEPHPGRLKSLLKANDNIELFDKPLQYIPIKYFEQLESGDILFIDSSHVSKIDSDVNYLIFEILPHLSEGVYIHLHDIFYPFEYPKEWILQKGMVWNELYLLRAFLQNNRNYSIQFFADMLNEKYFDKLMEKWPFEMPPQGSGIWLRKEVLGIQGRNPHTAKEYLSKSPCRREGL